MSAKKPVCLGLVGGIGSGKSTLAQWVARKLNWRVIDADKLGHQVLEEPAVIAELVRIFGEQITRSGKEEELAPTIDRARLARLVFGATAEAERNRQELEAVVHPRIAEKVDEEISKTTTEGVVIDAALLLEAGWRRLCDSLVFVRSTWESRVRRVEDRGWTAQQLREREAAQWPLDRKERECEWSVDNDVPIDIAGEALIEWLRRRYPLMQPAD